MIDMANRGLKHRVRSGKNYSRCLGGVFSAALLVLLSWHSPAAAENWAQRLGYPPEAKVLILYGTQMGVAHEINTAGAQGFEAGTIRSVGVLTPAPWFEQFATWCRQHPDADVGINLTLNSDISGYRWGPVSSRDQVAGLVDADGYLCASLTQTTANAPAEEVKREIDAQIHKAQAAGIRPGHLAPYMGTLFARPDLMEIYLSTARKHWIPAVVIELTPEHISWFRANGVPLDQRTVDLVLDYPLPKLDDLRFVPAAESLDEKRAALLATIDGLSPGITQIIFRPAIESEAIKALDPDWQQRVWESQLLVDPALQERLAAADVVLTDWKEIMRRYDGPAPEANERAESEPPVVPAADETPVVPEPRQ